MGNFAVSSILIFNEWKNAFVGSIEVLRNRESFTHLIFFLIYFFNKHSLSSYYVPCFELSTKRDTNEQETLGSHG